MTLSNILGIARSALLAHQRAMGITAGNIANAQTRGYTRQRVGLVPLAPQRVSGALLGTGVTLDGIRRVRDQFLDAAYRRESGSVADFGMMQGVLGSIESAIGEPSDSGIAASLDALWSAFGDLANDPTSHAARERVRGAARQFAERVRRLDGRISETANEVQARMQQEVADVNSITGRIATLNREIRSAWEAGAGDPALEDERDRLLDDLSGYLSIEVTAREDGTVAVASSGYLLVDGDRARILEARGNAERGLSIVPAGEERPLEPSSGSLRALGDLGRSILPDVRQRLDGFVAAVVDTVNGIHRRGYGANGETGIDFFDSSGRIAGRVRLSGSIEESLDAIAAGATDASGDNEIALQLSGLSHSGVDALGGRTLGEVFIGFTGWIGSQVRMVAEEAAAGEVLLARADAGRLGVSAVSIDEEMVRMVSQQEAYAAAARIVQVADSMIQEILRLI